MPYCPKCGAEYRDGFSRCSGCNVDLIEKKEKSEAEQIEEQKDNQHKVKPQPELGSEIALVTVDNEIELLYITSELEQNDILYRVMERGIGQYIKIWMGISYSYTGRTIFIDKKDFDKAEAIVESYKSEITE